MGHITFGIWIGYKKTLWIYIQKYGFIRKIEPFHLRLIQNIIQITATAGHTVPHSINPIFQYIFDCLGYHPMNGNFHFVFQAVCTDRIHPKKRASDVEYSILDGRPIECRKSEIRRSALRMSNIRYSTDGRSNVENPTSEEARFGCRIFDIRRRPISNRKSNLFAHL